MVHLQRSQKFSSDRVTIVAAARACRADASIDVVVAGRSNAYPSIAAIGQFVAITWGATAKGGATDIYSAISRDGGRTFGRPTQVNDRADSPASLSGEQPPRVSLVPRRRTGPVGRRAWTAKAPEGTRLLSARSDDGGRSFAPPGAGARQRRPGQPRLAGDRNRSDGRVVAIWLDHREPRRRERRPARRTHAGHQHGAEHGAQQMDGVARAQLSKLFFGAGRTPRRRACARRRRVLLLQDGDRDRRQRGDIRGVAARLSRKHARHRLHHVARRRPDVFSAGSHQRGRLGAQGLSGERPGDRGRRQRPHPRGLAHADPAREASPPWRCSMPHRWTVIGSHRGSGSRPRGCPGIHRSRSTRAVEWS